VHAAAGTKRRFWKLPCVDGGFLAKSLTYQSSAMLPAGDYVSEGLAVIQLDGAFPDMRAASPPADSWAFLRRDVPHNWYADMAVPGTGFLNRDEALILYNIALSFRGRRALEIGCHMGWSAAHMVAAGVDLDIVDPVLGQPERLRKVLAAINKVNPGGEVTCFAGFSPAAVREAAAARAPWSLIFIDGDHAPGAPLADVMECEHHAAADAAIVLHDLAAPAVAEALAYIGRRGWHTAIYHTAQIMGVAWRGDFNPVEHRPDPRVSWKLPRHLEPESPAAGLTA
jgi:predicted O-methyltransferase YrrM